MRKQPDRNDGFDVTWTVEHVIGRVNLDFGDGDEHPHVVAFKMIGEHSLPGTYIFPMESGATCHVTVTHDDSTS